MAAESPSGAGRKFYDDDPIRREPETQDASPVKASEIDVFLEPSPLLVDLERGEADVAIRYGTGGWPGARADLLVESRCYPVAHPSLVRRHGRPKSASCVSWPASMMPRRMARVRVNSSSSAVPSSQRIMR